MRSSYSCNSLAAAEQLEALMRHASGPMPGAEPAAPAGEQGMPFLGQMNGNPECHRALFCAARAVLVLCTGRKLRLVPGALLGRGDDTSSSSSTGIYRAISRVHLAFDTAARLRLGSHLFGSRSCFGRSKTPPIPRSVLCRNGARLRLLCLHFRLPRRRLLCLQLH